jgi:hypothetical protein
VRLCVEVDGGQDMESYPNFPSSQVLENAEIDAGASVQDVFVCTKLVCARYIPPRLIHRGGVMWLG